MSVWIVTGFTSSHVWWGRSDYIVFEATGQFYFILSRMELKQYMEQLHDGKWFDKQYELSACSSVLSVFSSGLFFMSVTLLVEVTGVSGSSPFDHPNFIVVFSSMRIMNRAGYFCFVRTNTRYLWLLLFWLDLFMFLSSTLGILYSIWYDVVGVF